MHIGDIAKRQLLLKNHMLKPKEKSKTLFLHAQFCNMFIEHDKWQDEDEDDGVAADFPEYSMVQRIIDLQRGPADRSYVGSGNIDICDVGVEYEWTQSTDRKLHAFYRLKKFEWQLQRMINYLPFYVFFFK